MYYSFQCEGCGAPTLDDTFIRIGHMHHLPCGVCGGRLRRYIHQVTIARGMSWDFQPHLSNATGRPVSSMREFREQLKQAAARETEATGIPHEYVPVDPRDQAAAGVSDEGAEINAAVNRGVVLEQPRRVDHGAAWGEPDELIGEKT